jgi:hypothetical protein
MMDVLIIQAGPGGREPPEPPKWAGDLLIAFNNLLTEIQRMNATIETLADRVNAIETVSGSAIALLGGLKLALDEAIAGGDMGAVAELSERLSAQTAQLAAAVAANTMAADEQEPDPQLPVDTDQAPA